jgi:glycerol uptake facilitator-like aquaporin
LAAMCCGTTSVIWHTVGLIRSFVLEAVLTFLLMFVLLSVTTGSKEKGVLAGVAVGSVIGLEALFAGPFSGASRNPGRSLAPALVSLRFDNLWVYPTARSLGWLVFLRVGGRSGSGCLGVRLDSRVPRAAGSVAGLRNRTRY